MHDCSWGALVVGIQPLFPRVQVTVFLTTPRMVQYQNVSMKVIPKTIPHMFSNNLTETLTLCLKKKKSYFGSMSLQHSKLLYYFLKADLTPCPNEHFIFVYPSLKNLKHLITIFKSGLHWYFMSLFN